MERIAVIGAGAWGTALAVVARRNGREVKLWAREPEVVANINDHRENDLFLPDVTLDPDIRATSDLAEAVSGVDAVLMVTPAQHTRTIAAKLPRALPAGVPVVICAKGIEEGTGALLAEALEEVLAGTPLAVLSGPTFAREVALGLPTAVTLATPDETLGRAMMTATGGPLFRPYWSPDIVGAQIGGAVKNVLAIACGIVDGRKLGENARAALMTRGLAEIGRLGAAKGARMETIYGLSGLGDLTLTCASTQSRNTSLGKAMGEGQPLRAILDARRSVAEGVYTAASVTALAAKLGVEMPICAGVDAILHHGADIDATIEALLSRPFKAEHTAAQS